MKAEKEPKPAWVSKYNTGRKDSLKKTAGAASLGEEAAGIKEPRCLPAPLPGLAFGNLSPTDDPTLETARAWRRSRYFKEALRRTQGFSGQR